MKKTTKKQSSKITWSDAEVFVNTFTSVDADGYQYMTVEDFRYYHEAIIKKMRENGEL